jgi:hypothetical protein
MNSKIRILLNEGINELHFVGFYHAVSLVCTNNGIDTVASKSLGTRTSFLVFHFEPKAKAISAKT